MSMGCSPGPGKWKNSQWLVRNRATLQGELTVGKGSVLGPPPGKQWAPKSPERRTYRDVGWKASEESKRLGD